ncbi:hypothetical protein EDD18DRAFT_1470770 [Armillaria luteobubalina]|uniref:Uncharacterized protein n=1 Tax=Armillaria luteobubalina TaxID=153913 RepID=A0AA39U4V6_9AGAR|nr:hypothetical protein EDD18DRAFT_1470770 [Armillaria luteobubalina]
MTETIKDSNDDIQALSSPPRLNTSISLILTPPPPYSISIDQDVNNTKESHELKYESLTHSDPSASSYSPWCSFKRPLLIVAIFIYYVFVFTLYIYGKHVNKQVILDGLTWVGTTPSERCFRFGTREYSAELMGVPEGEYGMHWCKENEIFIHNVNLGKTGYCTVSVDLSAPRNHRIFGHWTVQFNNPRCKTAWEDFQDKAWMRYQSLKDSCAVSKLAWVNTDRHRIIGERCVRLPQRIMMDAISIGPIAESTGELSTAYGVFGLSRTKAADIRNFLTSHFRIAYLS